MRNFMIGVILLCEAGAFSISLDELDRSLSYRDLAPLLNKRCAICHKGPYLDLSQYPLYSDKFNTPEKLGAEILRRLRLDKWGKMPPVNAIPLEAQEISALEEWITSGMPSD